MQPRNRNDPIPEQAAIPAVTTPPPRLPKPTPSDPTIPKASGSSLSKSRERPSQLSLSTSENEGVSLHGSQEHSVYVNSISLVKKRIEKVVKEKEKEKGKRRLFQLWLSNRLTKNQLLQCSVGNQWDY